MMVIRLSEMLDALQHVSRMKREPGGRIKPSDRVILRPAGKDLDVQLPGGGTIIAAEGGTFERQIAIAVPALESLQKGLAKFKAENPVVILTATEDHLAVQCEALKVKIPLKP